MFKSLLMAFSLYSKIPVPQVQWDEKSMRYCLSFLPAVGVVIGAAQYLAFRLLRSLSFGPLLCGAVLCALPVFLSGGFHLDGFLDTCDALHSYADREKRLEILKDPHVGAFAVIGGILYFVLSLGVWSEAGDKEIISLCLLFPLSRALSAFSAMTFPKAKKSGLLRQETDSASKGVGFAMAAVSVLIAAVLIWANPVQGIAAAVVSLIVLAWYRFMSEKQFGGITGDLSGWYTQVCELAAAYGVLFASRLF